MLDNLDIVIKSNLANSLIIKSKDLSLVFGEITKRPRLLHPKYRHCQSSDTNSSDTDSIDADDDLSTINSVFLSQETDSPSPVFNYFKSNGLNF